VVYSKNYLAMGKKYQPQPISEVPAQLRFQCCDHPDVFNRTTVEEEPYIIISFGVTRSIFSDGFFNDFFDMNIYSFFLKFEIIN